MEATVEILRRIGDRVKAGGTYRSEELELDTASYGIQGDPWHVPVKVVSRYAAMPDIKAKLVESHPDLEGKDWSMRYGAYGGGIVASWDGGTGRLSYDEMKALEADHVSDMQVEDVLKRWHVPCDKGEWPPEFGYGPAWVTLKSLTAMRNRLMAHLTSMGREALGSSLDDLEFSGARTGKLLFACMAALAAVADDPDLAVFVRMG